MPKRKKDKRTNNYTDREPRTPLRRGWTQMLRKGKQFLLHYWHPWYYSSYRPGDKSIFIFINLRDTVVKCIILGQLKITDGLNNNLNIRKYTWPSQDKIVNQNIIVNTIFRHLYPINRTLVNKVLIYTNRILVNKVLISINRILVNKVLISSDKRFER